MTFSHLDRGDAQSFGRLAAGAAPPNFPAGGGATGPASARGAPEGLTAGRTAPRLGHRSLADDTELTGRFRGWIEERAFPCVGAKSALARDQMHIVVARDLRSSWDDLRIYQELLDFAINYKSDARLFQSFIVLFGTPGELTEDEFEELLWVRVQSLADKDAWHGQGYDARVSADPDSPHFSLSFGGEAFFVVGLHPGASRPARRFERPALVFNPHDQFERLRAENRYEPLRRKIVERDVALAGAPNPMLARHGEVSEARQYSGRQVTADWRCPFSAKPKVRHDDL